MAPNNALPVWGNEKTMNMNTLILTNIQSSPYFKVNLFELKTYHEVIDEIYYKVGHLEPWEKGSRKTAGQTGMCGGVRGVGAGGIVSSAYCLLHKLFTLKLTKKQLVGLINHADSPYIRGLGFMYIRYTQPPADLWGWYEDYLDDEEEIDVKAGGGHALTMGELCRQFLVKLEWYSTLFPRIPVPVQKTLREKLSENPPTRPMPVEEEEEEEVRERPRKEDVSFGEAERVCNRRSPQRRRSRSPPRRSPHRSSGSPSRYDREKDRYRDQRGDDFARVLERERERQRREKEKPNQYDRSGDKKKDKRSHSQERKKSGSRECRDDRISKNDRHRTRTSDEDKYRKRSRSRERKESRKEKQSRSHEQKRPKSRERKRARSQERKRSRSKEHRSSKERSHDKRSRRANDHRHEFCDDHTSASRNGES